MSVDEAAAGIQYRARWSRLAAVGLFLAACGPLLIFGAGTLWGLDISDDAPFFLTTGACGVAASILVWRFGSWAKIVGILVALGLSGALFWTAFSLLTPTSVFDFLPGVLVLPGALVGLISCVAAIVAARRGHVSPMAEGGERSGIRVALGIVIVLGLGSTALTVAGRSTAEGAAAELTVIASDFEFDADAYTAEQGSEILIRNEDPFLHTFTIDDLDIDVVLSPGSEETVEISGAPGEYIAFCRPHTFNPESPSGDDMAATVIVK